MLLKLGEGLLEETFATLRGCGDGSRECVVYWAGPVDEPHLVDRVIHPEHIGEPDYYELEQEWLNWIWSHLRAEHIQIRAQVHTHGRRAFHSTLDDEYPFLQTEGFSSLVIPNYGTGPVSLDDTFLVELSGQGTWHELDPQRSLRAAA